MKLDMSMKSRFINTSRMICLCFAILCTQGCSIVQWLPSSACEYVKYERVHDHVSVNAECDV